MSTDASPTALDNTGLDNTVTARWRAGLGGHRRTKIGYYDAVDRLLAASPGSALTWKSVVAAVRPRGCRTTFYEVTGPGAKYPLIGQLRASDRAEIARLALRYTRSTPVDQLIDETKVDRYWPYRSAWLHQYELRPDLTASALVASLVCVVAEWARCHRPLAAALDHAPPVCAVEDLTVCGRGRISAIRAHAILVKVVRHTLNAPDDLADPVDNLIDLVRADLGLVVRRVPSPEAMVVELAEQIYTLAREAQRLGPMHTVPAWRAATDLMRDALAATT